MSVSPSVSFITFSASYSYAGSVTIYTSSNMWADNYNITIIGEIQALQKSTYYVSFTLTVEGTCKYSTEIIVLTAGTALAS
jgi:hypothetical protein